MYKFFISATPASLLLSTNGSVSEQADSKKKAEIYINFPLDNLKNSITLCLSLIILYKKKFKMKRENTNKYIGDDAFIKMLEHYKCLTPISVIKMRFLGAICSPNKDLRPTDVISSFWGAGLEPRLQTREEADLFFKFFMGLWDELFDKVADNKVSLPKFLSKKDLKACCALRFEEIELGYVEGFWGGREDIEIPAFLAEIIDNLSELSSIYKALEKKLDRNDDIEEIKATLKHTDNMIEKTISFIIENSVLPRIETVQRVMN